MAKKRDSVKVQTIESLSDNLEAVVKAAAKDFFNMVDEEFISKLRLENGRIMKIAANISLITRIDKTYKEFSDKVLVEIMQTIKTGVDEVLAANVDYYGTFADNASKFRKTTAADVKSTVYRRLGLDDSGKLLKDGYMRGLLDDITVKNQIKDFAFRNILTSNGLEDFRSKLRGLINGDKKGLGIFEKFYKGLAYDVYARIDRMNSLLYAEFLGLEYFIYDGGIIKTTRPFCREKAGLVFWIKEAEVLWPKDINAPKIPDYKPIIDMGGFNCRHTPRFISKELAFQLRPELANMTDPTED